MQLDDPLSVPLAATPPRTPKLEQAAIAVTPGRPQIGPGGALPPAQIVSPWRLQGTSSASPPRMHRKVAAMQMAAMHRQALAKSEVYRKLLRDNEACGGGLVQVTGVGGEPSLQVLAGGRVGARIPASHLPSLMWVRTLQGLAYMAKADDFTLLNAGLVSPPFAAPDGSESGALQHAARGIALEAVCHHRAVEVLRDLIHHRIVRRDAVTDAFEARFATPPGPEVHQLFQKYAAQFAASADRPGRACLDVDMTQTAR